MWRAVLCAFAVSAFVSGCAQPAEVLHDADPGTRTDSHTGGDTPTASHTEPGGQPPVDQPTVDQPPGPPPVVVRDQDSALTLEPWTSCWSADGMGQCVDGAPPEIPPDLGARSTEIVLSYPVGGWSFDVDQLPPNASPGEETCQVSARVEQLDQHTWRIRPGGPAGLYRIEIWGTGPQGDLSASFRVHFAVDHSGAEPNGSPCAGAQPKRQPSS